ncbi:MAG: YfhO family protein [Actinomycetota bacterium]
MSAADLGVDAPTADDAGGSRRTPTFARRVIAPVAGPALIVALVLITLRGFAFSPDLTNRHPDILAFWLPRFTFLGRSLASGHIPLWNPFEMAGYRFAADPQSGWLYLPAMTFFSWLDPGRAMRALIVFNPLLAGLGMYWFLRKESLVRPAATAGGACLAMLMSASEISISMPFAGFLAWTTLVLVSASGYRQATRWSRRLAWLAGAGLAWSQVANAHMSHGLVMCSLMVTSYLLAFAVRDVRAGDLRPAGAALRTGVFLVFLPVGSLAVLIPRLSYIKASSLHAGYGAIAGSATATSGTQDRTLQTNGVWAAWPLGYAITPTSYAGAVILLSALVSWRARAHRALVWAFTGTWLLTYVLMLNVVVTNGAFRSLMLHVPFGDVYLHNVGRLRYLSVIALPVLGAVGLQSLFDRPLNSRLARRWLGGGVALLLVLPLAMGARPVRYVEFAGSLLFGIPALWFLATRRSARAKVAVMGVLIAELLVSGVYSSVWPGGAVLMGLESGANPNLVPQPISPPNVQESAFFSPPAFLDPIRSQKQRYLTWVLPAASFEKGYLFAQHERDWPALTMERGTLFGIPDMLGYNPVQSVRYWSYIRASDHLSVFYNASVVNNPTLGLVRLFGVRYLITLHGQQPVGAPGRVVMSADGYDLVEVYGWEPRVSVVPAWTVSPDENRALAAVLDPSFNPASSVVLEADPGITATAPAPFTPPATRAPPVYVESDPEHIRLDVSATQPSIVLVRDSYDPGWSATVDGRPAPLLAADYVMQGVPVEPGHHIIELTYRDSAITTGLRASAAAWGSLFAALVGALILERIGKRRRRAS